MKTLLIIFTFMFSFNLSADDLLITMQAPITKFVSTLNEVPSKFVRGLAAVRDQKPA